MYVCICLLLAEIVCLRLVCWHLTGHNSRAIFTKLHRHARTFPKDSSTLRDEAVFSNFVHIFGKTDRIFAKISSHMYLWIRTFLLAFRLRIRTPDLDSGRETHSYFSFNFSHWPGRVLNTPNLVRLHNLWYRPKFRASSICNRFLVCFSCLFVYFRPTGHNSRAAFTKLHTQVGTTPGEKWLNYQGYGVKGKST